MMKFFLATTICLCSTLLPSAKAKAADFSLNPNITFEVGDGFFGGSFDGQGDTDAIFSDNFDTVVLGNFGENSENAEFDISGLDVPSEESITKAIFQITVLPNETFGLGATGQRPSSLAVRGYIGNGQPDATDFQAGTILDTASVSPEYIEEFISFDVTSFIQNIVSNQNNFAGFGVRAQTIGGITLDRGTFSDKGPRLTITTARANTTIPEPNLALGILTSVLLGGIVFKKK
ncbi:MAG: PEP-CTERM sorting domain-containing protein [Nostocales cyanobacterium 94392]|nr:PEP-CTERM sorting domain-containing protein [Nostocales cyanobacterium 94392]